ncbi:hypothetical protein J6A64_05845 [bacterium]|nr:hypothetical protein [bacterium]
MSNKIEKISLKNIGAQIVFAVVFVSFIYLVCFGFPNAKVSCVNKDCSIYRGDKIISRFDAGDIYSCAIQQQTERVSSTSSSIKRTKTIYVPKIVLKNGTNVDRIKFFFYNSSEAKQFCNSIRTNPHFSYTSNTYGY